MILLRIIFFTFIILSSTYCQKNYFYKGLDYGSQAMFNPLSIIINGGFDIVQLGDRRNLTKFKLASGLKNVFRNLKDPFPAIRKYGWSNFIKQEIFPLSFDPENMQYLPNYQLHLIGGGATYAALEEWYLYNNIPSASLLSAVTVLTYEILNEAVENGDYQGGNVDLISDIYIFDIAGIILFTSDNVRRFFSEDLNLSDWSLQPTYLLGKNELHNTGQFFSLKWKFPFSDNLHLFYCFGTCGVLGLSFRFEDGNAVSLGYGVQTADLIILDKSTNKKTVNLNGNVGIYFDRNNSLLASLTVNFKTELMKYHPGTIINYLANLNVYPGALKLGSFSPGFWSAIKHNGSFYFGISAKWSPIGIACNVK